MLETPDAFTLEFFSSTKARLTTKQDHEKNQEDLLGTEGELKSWTIRSMQFVRLRTGGTYGIKRGGSPLLLTIKQLSESWHRKGVVKSKVEGSDKEFHR